jgi:integrase
MGVPAGSYRDHSRDDSRFAPGEHRRKTTQNLTRVGGVYRHLVWAKAHLRHACASWLIHAGANPLEVAARLRHARVTTTLATYGHLFPGTDDRLDALLADIWAESLAAQPRPNGVVARISGGANPR